MKGIETCERHDLPYKVDEGCEYCYKEWQDKQKLIKEFLKDLKESRYIAIDVYIEKWEGELKK